MPRKIQLSVNIEAYESRDELPSAFQQLLATAEESSKDAYAPYSKFQVGAALLLEDGTVVTGSNQENLAYPSGMCAERAAFYWTGAQHPNKKILAVAVAARPVAAPAFVHVSPCGACRQAMLEYELKQGSAIKVIMPSQEKGHVWVAASIADLLPIQFNADL